VKIVLTSQKMKYFKAISNHLINIIQNINLIKDKDQINLFGNNKKDKIVIKTDQVLKVSSPLN